MNRRQVGAAFLLLVLTGCAGSPSSPGPDEENAASALEKLGARMERDETKPGKPVIAVSLFEVKITDELLKDLKELKQLTRLDFAGGKVTNEDLKELKELKQLKKLWLVDSEITDAGLKELKELKQLTFLNVINTKVTDAGVEELQAALPKCNIRR